jgi:hypothetical protein
VLASLLALALALALAAQPTAPPAGEPTAPPPKPTGTATPPEPATPTAPPPADALAPPADANAGARERMFDVAFEALAAGDLTMAEQAFARAAALPGDPARQQVAASFAERARRLRIARTAAAPAAIATRAEPDVRSGRVPFLLTTAALGLGLYGWTLPNAVGLDPDDSPRLFVGSYMLTAASAFGVPFFLTRSGRVSPAQANLAFYGGTRGMWHGVLVGSLAAGHLSIDRRFRGWSASLLLGSLAGLTGGFFFAGEKALTPGQARTIAVGGDFGLLLGFGSGFLLDLDRRDSADAEARGMSAAGLAGAAVGLGVGHALARRGAYGHTC